MSTHDIAASLRLGIDDLPSLVLLRKRTDWRDNEHSRLILRLRGAPDVVFLIDFLRAFRKSLERIETARSAGFKFSERSLAEVERNMTSRVEQIAVIDKRVKRIARLVGEAQAISESSDHETERAPVAERQLNRAKIAKHNAEVQIAKLEAQVPVEAALRCATLFDEEILELQAVIDRFERRLSYDLKNEKIFQFLGLSEKLLGSIKRIIRLAATIKTGGAAL